MPLPLIIGIAAGISAASGVGFGVHGGVKMKQAKDTMKDNEARYQRYLAKFENQNKETTKIMDALGKYELDILHGFDKFSDLIEKIQNRPVFKKYSIDGLNLPEYKKEELKKISIGAGVLIGGLTGAAAGTAGGFAAAGATTAAVMALGTASTGTAIASLSGAAATNATLAALGGGAIAAGGGGIALGTTMLGVATLGVGILVGGAIFGITGNTLASKAKKASHEVDKAQIEINRICYYLDDLYTVSDNYKNTLERVNNKYAECYKKLETLICNNNITDWEKFSEDDKLNTENLILLVGVLWEMCKVKIVIPQENNNINKINKEEIWKNQNTAIKALDMIRVQAA